MRNITKILLLIVVAFAAYLLWPRSASLSGFKPAEMARLQIQNWQGQKDNKGMGSLMARYKIYATQYHISPVTAFRMAQTQGGVLAAIANLKNDDSDSVSENRVLGSLTEKYSMLKQAVNGSFDPDALAREEYGWRVTEKDPSGSSDVIIPSICRILAALYGGNPEDYTEAATNIAKARMLVLTGGDLAEAKSAAQEGYSLLHEIATTPPATAVEGPTPTPAP